MLTTLVAALTIAALNMLSVASANDAYVNGYSDVQVCEMSYNSVTDNGVQYLATQECTDANNVVTVDVLTAPGAETAVCELVYAVDTSNGVQYRAYQVCDYAENQENWF